MIELKCEIRYPSGYNFHMQFLKELSGKKSGTKSFKAFIKNDATKIAEKTVKRIREIILSEMKFSRMTGGLLDCVTIGKPETHASKREGTFATVGVFNESRANKTLKITKVSKRVPSGEEIAYYAGSRLKPKAGTKERSEEYKAGTYWQILEYGHPPYQMTWKQAQAWAKMLSYMGLYDSAYAKKRAKARVQERPWHPGIRAYRYLDRGFRSTVKETVKLAATAIERYKHYVKKKVKKYG